MDERRFEVLFDEHFDDVWAYGRRLVDARPSGSLKARSTIGQLFRNPPTGCARA